MTDAPHLQNLDKMFAIWNEADAARRATLAAEALEHNLHFVDPRHNIMGHAAFLDMVAATRAEIPGAVYARVSDVGLQNNFCRYHWRITRDDEVLLDGFDVVEVSDAGRVRQVIGFFGKLEARPPA